MSLICSSCGLSIHLPAATMFPKPSQCDRCSNHFSSHSREAWPRRENPVLPDDLVDKKTAAPRHEVMLDPRLSCVQPGRRILCGFLARFMVLVGGLAFVVIVQGPAEALPDQAGGAAEGKVQPPPSGPQMEKPLHFPRKTLGQWIEALKRTDWQLYLQARDALGP